MMTLKTLLTGVFKSFQIISTLLKKRYQQWNKWEKKGLLIVLSYLEVISLETRIKLQQAFIAKLEIALKCQTRRSNSFRLKDPIPKDLMP